MCRVVWRQIKDRGVGAIRFRRGGGIVAGERLSGKLRNSFGKLGRASDFSPRSWTRKGGAMVI